MHRRFVPALLFPPVTLFAFVLLAVSPAQASFVNLGPAGDFNVFVLNDNTQSGSDAEGRVAVGNNAHLSTYSVASHMGSGTDNLIVGGNLTKVSTNFHGDLLVNGNVDWNTPTISGRVAVNGNATFTGGGNIVGPVTVAGTYTAPPWFPANNPGTTPLPFAFGEVGDYLISQSAYLASLPANGTTTISFEQVHLTANNPGDTYVSFNVTGAEMAAADGAGLFITAPAGATVVVNVSGTIDSMASMGIFLTGVDQQHVLYNFFEATSLTLAAIGVEGSILAPLADVNFASGNIDGTLIARNLTGMGESHDFLFEGDLPLNPVPEPSTILLGLSGLAALAVHGLRRRRAIAR